MRPKILILLCWLVATNVYGQSNNIDSLKNALAAARNDTVRLQCAGNLTDAYTEIQADSALRYCQMELDLAKELGFRLSEAYALQQMGYVLINMGNYPESLKMLLSALVIVEDPASEKKILPDQYKYGEDIFVPAMTPRQKRLDKLGRMHEFVGIVYSNGENHEKEKFHYLEAERLLKQTGNVLVSSYCNGTLGRSYINLKMYDSAEITLQKAVNESQQVGYRKYEGSFLLNFARLRLALKDTAAAIIYYRTAMQVSKEFGYLRGVTAASLALANVHMKNGRRDSALLFINQGLETAQQLNAPPLLLRSYTALSEYYRAIQNSDSLVKYQDLIVGINNQLFNSKQAQLFQSIDFDDQQKQQQKEAADRAYITRLKIYGLLLGLAAVIILAIVLWRNNRHRQRAFLALQQQKRETDIQREKAETTLVELKSAQAQLIQSEKMASLGELTAGIAHEIENPLNFVNNFSEVNAELIADMRTALQSGKNEEALAIAKDIENNMLKISDHGKRADDIVKSMLQHSSSGSGQKELTNINYLCEEYLRLSYHGMRARDKQFKATITSDFDPSLKPIDIIPQDLGRVLMNICNNAFYAVGEKKKRASDLYEPRVLVATGPASGRVKITVRDNGIGIPEKFREKIFQPFFTTMPAGKGTGLGLSLSYDIMKAMGGEIKVDSKEGEWTEFSILLNGANT